MGHLPAVPPWKRGRNGQTAISEKMGGMEKGGGMRQSNSLTSVHTPPCAIASINICVHDKDPVVYARVWWIMETPTLSQLAFPKESNLNFPWEKSQWDNSAEKKQTNNQQQLKTAKWDCKSKQLYNNEHRTHNTHAGYDEAHRAATVAMYKPQASVPLTECASGGTLGLASSACRTSAWVALPWSWFPAVLHLQFK